VGRGDVMAYAYTTCSVCGWREADAELVEESGLIVAIAFSCSACGALTVEETGVTGG